MKNLSLRAKLMSLSAFLLIVAISIGGVSYWGLGRVEARFSTISDVSFPNATTMLQMFSTFRYMRVQALIIAANSASDTDKEEALKVMEESFTLDENLHKKYMDVPFLPGEEGVYNPFREALGVVMKDFKDVVALKKTGDPKDYEKLREIVFKKIPTESKPVQEAVDKLQTFHAINAAEAADDAKTTGANMKLLSLFLLGIGGSIGIVCSLLVSNSLVKLLSSIGDALDRSIAQVSSASNQIAASSDGLSQATSEQAASLQETSASIEELNSMVAQNSENSRSTAKISLESKGKAEHGRTVVDDMIKSMQMINDSNTNVMQQVTHSSQQMAEIVNVIQEIESKTKVINDIVFQTKLLSFNASVEAARAGEQGKGFAVVAEEVGNLAQMSGNASKEISSMLAESIKKVESIAQETKAKVEVLMVESQAKIKTGSDVARQCGDVLSEIVGNVGDVSNRANEISVASEEQSKGIQEITKAVSQMDQVTQLNAATSQETATAAGELSSQATLLIEQAASLIAAIYGGKTKLPEATQAAPTKLKVVATEKPAKKADAPVAKASKPADKKVVKMEKPTAAAASAPLASEKKVAGSDVYPSPDDKNFEDL